MTYLSIAEPVIDNVHSDTDMRVLVVQHVFCFTPFLVKCICPKSPFDAVLDPVHDLGGETRVAMVVL